MCPSPEIENKDNCLKGKVWGKVGIRSADARPKPYLDADFYFLRGI
jgi:hypothetical protein